jgi:hypothetical protein
VSNQNADKQQQLSATPYQRQRQDVPAEHSAGARSPQPGRLERVRIDFIDIEQRLNGHGRGPGRELCSHRDLGTDSNTRVTVAWSAVNRQPHPTNTAALLINGLHD